MTRLPIRCEVRKRHYRPCSPTWGVQCTDCGPVTCNAPNHPRAIEIALAHLAIWHSNQEVVAQ